MVLLWALWCWALRHSSDCSLVFLLWGLAGPVKDSDSLKPSSSELAPSYCLLCSSVALTETFTIHHCPASSAMLSPVPAASAGSVHSLTLSMCSSGRCKGTTLVFVFDSVLLDILVQQHNFLVLFTNQENIIGNSVALISNNYFEALK